MYIQYLQYYIFNSISLPLQLHFSNNQCHNMILKIKLSYNSVIPAPNVQYMKMLVLFVYHITGYFGGFKIL
jgi:hypothetical protein